MSKARIALSSAASLAAPPVLIRSTAKETLPSEIENYFYSSSFHKVSRCMSLNLTIVIEEFQGLAMNQVFEAAHLYLGVTTTAASTKRFIYNNVKMKWRLISVQVQAAAAYRNCYLGDYDSSLQSEVRHYELGFHKEHKDMVLNMYLPYILAKADAVKRESNMIKLHTVSYDRWDANDTLLKHPMTFKTLALDSELQKDLMEDLENFMNGKEYYKRIW